MILIIVAFVLLCAEYLWLFIVAEKQEEQLKSDKESKEKLATMFDAVIYSPTAEAQDDEIEALTKYVGRDYRRLDFASVYLLALQKKFNDLTDLKRDGVDKLTASLDPVSAYEDRLSRGNVYEQAYACRRLADFDARGSEDDIRSRITSHNDNLSYHAAMAMSQFGDEQAVIKYIKRCEKNIKFSHRVIMELFDIYSGDKVMLVNDLYYDCSDYMKATIIKAVARDKLTALMPIYEEELQNPYTDIRIACVKAISFFEDAQFEHMLLTALNDKNWVIRAQAVRGLEKINNEVALEAIVKATQDEEWWVRQTAANSLVNMDLTLEHIDKVLNGYDKYAADAVKSSLYRVIDMKNSKMSAQAGD